MIKFSFLLSNEVCRWIYFIVVNFRIFVIYSLLTLQDNVAFAFKELNSRLMPFDDSIVYVLFQYALPIARRVPT